MSNSVFPGLQGSTLLNAIAAKAVCLGEALQPEFTVYAERVLANARALAGMLTDLGISLVTGGTDTPLMLADLRPLGLTGSATSDSLEAAGLICNKNAVPGDTRPPNVTSGLRFGVSAVTTRGFNAKELGATGEWIAEVIHGLAANPDSQRKCEAHVRHKVLSLCERFPIYPNAP